MPFIIGGYLRDEKTKIDEKIAEITDFKKKCIFCLGHLQSDIDMVYKTNYF